MIIKPAFITPVFEFDLDNTDLNNRLREDAYLQQKNNNGRVISNVGGFQSSHVYDTPAVKDFFKTIVPYIEQVKKIVNYNNDLNLEGLWYNINKKGDSNKMHCHGKSIFGATYYIDAPQDCGAIAFENLDKHIVMNSDNDAYDNPYFNGFYNLIPKANHLVVFYAWLNHQVNKNKSDKDRVSLAFNIQ
jgi:uncharacterized protein (TIGR02466 family)